MARQCPFYADDAALSPSVSRQTEVLEGPWTGHLIVLEFPDMDAAREWYRSPEFQGIVRLRTENSQGDTVLVEGVAEGHHATDL